VPPKKKKKNLPSCPPDFFWVGGYACPPLLVCLPGTCCFVGPPGWASLSPSLLRLFCSFPCACWRWLELCCFLGTDAEGRKDRDQISSASTLEQLCCAFHKLSCVVCEAQKKKKKKKRNKETKLKCSETDSHSCVFKLFQLFFALPASPRDRQRETEYNSQRDRETETERVYGSELFVVILLLLLLH